MINKKDFRLSDTEGLQLLICIRLTGMFRLSVGGLLVGCLLTSDRFWILGYPLTFYLQADTLAKLCKRYKPLSIELANIIRCFIKCNILNILFILFCLLTPWKNEVYRIALVITSSLWLHRVPLNFILKKPFINDIMYNMCKV